MHTHVKYIDNRWIGGYNIPRTNKIGKDSRRMRNERRTSIKTNLRNKFIICRSLLIERKHMSFWDRLKYSRRRPKPIITIFQQVDGQDASVFTLHPVSEGLRLIDWAHYSYWSSISHKAYKLIWSASYTPIHYQHLTSSNLFYDTNSSGSDLNFLNWIIEAIRKRRSSNQFQNTLGL